MSNQLTKKQLNFDVLDNIRGLAAFYVVINHCRGTLLMGGNELSQSVPFATWSIFTKIYYALLQFTSLGKEVVILFFVLSGFSIAHSLKSNYTSKSYYLKRITRMYLPMIVSLFWAYYVSLQIHLIGGVFQNFYSIIYNLLFIPTGALIPQFWSISHEALFYLFAPIINRIKKINLLYVVFCIFICLFIVGFFVERSSIILQFIFDYSLFFMLGIILYFKIESIIQMKFFRHKLLYFISLLFISVGVIAFHFLLGEYNRVNIFLGGLAGFITIPFFIKHNINMRVLKFLGTISFTLYLSHFASIYFFTDILLKYKLIPKAASNLWWPWLLGIVFCVLISIPFYYMAEKPSKLIILKLRSKSSK